jgi:hypothetical protein
MNAQSLNRQCAHCHTVLAPADLQRIDGEHMLCAEMSEEICAQQSGKADSDYLIERVVAGDYLRTSLLSLISG